MSKIFKEKLLYILLGIGIGLVTSSSLFIINSTEQVKEYSDEEIIQKAKELGMVYIKDVVQVNEKNNDKNDDKSDDKNDNNESVQVREDEGNSRLVENLSNTEYIEFTIDKGESTESVSKRLFEKGIIDDSGKFNTYISKKGLEKKILYGNYKIKKGSTYDELIKLFTQVN